MELTHAIAKLNELFKFTNYIKILSPCTNSWKETNWDFLYGACFAGRYTVVITTHVGVYGCVRVPWFMVSPNFTGFEKNFAEKNISACTIKNFLPNSTDMLM